MLDLGFCIILLCCLRYGDIYFKKIKRIEMNRLGSFFRRLFPRHSGWRRRIKRGRNARKMVSENVMRVDFVYLHERRERLSHLAHELGMGMDDMVQRLRERYDGTNCGGNGKG